VATTVLFGVLVVIGVCLAAVAGLELVQRLVPSEKRQQNNDVAGFLYAVVGVVYAVRSEGERGTPEGWDLIEDMRATLQGFKPQTGPELELYGEGLDQIDRLGDARRMRLVAAEEGMPGVLWAVLVFGAVVVGFTYLFGLQNTWAHRLMVLSLTAVIALVLFTIGAMEYPFSGGARIGPGAFELILERFETSKLSVLP
jgi:Protein of unknown function (DUF4239)